MVEELLSKNKEELEEIINAIKQGLRSGIKEVTCVNSGYGTFLQIEDNDIVGVKCSYFERHKYCCLGGDENSCFYLKPWRRKDNS